MLLPWTPKIKRSWSALREATEPSARSFLERRQSPKRNRNLDVWANAAWQETICWLVLSLEKFYWHTTNTIFVYSSRIKHFKWIIWCEPEWIGVTGFAWTALGLKQAAADLWNWECHGVPQSVNQGLTTPCRVLNTCYYVFLISLSLFEHAMSTQRSFYHVLSHVVSSAFGSTWCHHGVNTSFLLAQLRLSPALPQEADPPHCARHGGGASGVFGSSAGRMSTLVGALLGTSSMKCHDSRCVCCSFPAPWWITGGYMEVSWNRGRAIVIIHLEMDFP